MGTADASQAAGTSDVAIEGVDAAGAASLVRICSIAASTAEGLRVGVVNEPASPSPLPLVPVLEPLFDAVLVVVLLLVKI